VPPDILNKVFCKSSKSMDEIPDNSIHLMVTSPPYNVTKEYDKNLTLDEYRELLKRVFRETYKKLVIGGRACVNIANVGRIRLLVQVCPQHGEAGNLQKILF